MSGEAVTTQPKGKRAEVMAYVRDLDPSQVLGEGASCKVVVASGALCWSSVRFRLELL